MLTCCQHALDVSECCSEYLITAAKHIFPPTLDPSAPSPANEVSGVSRPCRRQGLVSRGTQSFKQKMQKSSGRRSPRSHLINRRRAGGQADGWRGRSLQGQPQRKRRRQSPASLEDESPALCNLGTLAECLSNVIGWASAASRRQASKLCQASDWAAE